MNENQTFTENINWGKAFRDSLDSTVPHQAVGMPTPVEVTPIDLKELSKTIDITSEEDIIKALDYAVDLTPAYSGITADEFYEANGMDKDIPKRSAQELTDILLMVTNSTTQDLNLPQGVAKLITEPKAPLTPHDVKRGTIRGILTAKQCAACEQVDPVVGAQIHIASGILNRVYKNPDINDFWNETYLEGSVGDINNPQTIGIVDLLILVVENNKEKFPELDRFFGSNLVLGEGEGKFEGTYYDMVDLPEYKDSK